MGCPYSKAAQLPIITWTEIARVSQTGDILLFGGTTLPALVEECVTATPYSHVAMFFRDPKTQNLYILESSGKDGLIDAFTGRDKSGPRLVDAKQKIKEYVPKYGWGVAFRRLKGDKIDQIRSSNLAMNILFEWMKNQSEKRFEMHKLEMGESFTHRTLFSRSQDSCSWFCSEFVAAAWMKMGISMRSARADNFCPQDFTEDEEDLFDLSFYGNRGGYLTHEELVVFP